MSYEGRSAPGRRTILVGLLLVVAAFLLQALALAVLPNDRATATLTIMVCSLLLAVTVLAALRGLARLDGHIRDLHHRLAQALTDPVTGLPVRRVAEDAIAATDSDIALTVALADVDRLHKINHGPGGHAVGDRYLAEVGLRLRHAATDGDIVARLGGDEFVLITRRSPEQLADSLTAALAVPAAVAGVVRSVEVSVGICQLPGGDPHQLLSCSSSAMFTAKDRRSRIEFYDPARDGLPLPLGVRPGFRRRDRRPGA
jgi:diguanylate cyclase (GGDEF)-like protein